MGANAQTSVPTFTAGEVLTAANMNISARTGIPVFADATARNAAFGGTGEKTLAEGQFAYLEDTNATQYYDGAAWQSVGVAPGLVLVSTTTIGSAVSSVTVSGAFSATYDAYKIIITGGASSSATPSLRLQLGATTANYAMVSIYAAYNNTAAAVGSSAQASFLYAGSGSSTSLHMNLDVLNPYLTELTFVNGFNSSSADAGAVSGYLNNSTSYTDFTILVSTGNITGGTIRVYGYTNS